MRSISRRLRRISVRVVNFGGASLEDEVHVRLPSDDDDQRAARGDDEEGSEKVDEPLPDSSVVRLLRGRTLGFFGPTSRVRLAMYEILIFPCVPMLFSLVHFA